MENKQALGQKRQLVGSNSFIATETLEEFQMDLMFFSDIERNSVALLMVDIFTKSTHIVPLNSKQPEDVLDGIKKCVDKMGVPKSVYCDVEGSFISNLVKKYLDEQNVKLIRQMGMHLLRIAKYEHLRI